MDLGKHEILGLGRVWFFAGPGNNSYYAGSAVSILASIVTGLGGGASPGWWVHIQLVLRSWTEIQGSFDLDSPPPPAPKLALKPRMGVMTRVTYGERIPEPGELGK